MTWDINYGFNPKRESVFFGFVFSGIKTVKGGGGWDGCGRLQLIEICAQQWDEWDCHLKSYQAKILGTKFQELIPIWPMFDGWKDVSNLMWGREIGLPCHTDNRKWGNKEKKMDKERELWQSEWEWYGSSSSLQYGEVYTAGERVMCWSLIPTSPSLHPNPHNWYCNALDTKTPLTQLYDPPPFVQFSIDCLNNVEDQL